MIGENGGGVKYDEEWERTMGRVDEAAAFYITEVSNERVINMCVVRLTYLEKRRR